MKREILATVLIFFVSVTICLGKNMKNQYIHSENLFIFDNLHQNNQDNPKNFHFIEDKNFTFPHTKFGKITNKIDYLITILICKFLIIIM